MSAAATSKWEFGFPRVTKGLLLVLLTAFGGALSILLPPKVLLFVIPAAVIVLVLVIRFEWAVFPVLLLIPVAERSVGVMYKAPWNFIVRDRPIDVFGFYMPFVAVALIGLVLRVLSRSRLPGEKALRNSNALTVPVLVLLGYAAITLFFTEAYEHSLFQMYVMLLNAAILALMVCSVRDETFHKKVMWFLVAVGIVHALIVVALYGVKTGAIDYDRELSGNVHFLAKVLTGGKNKGLFVRRGNAFNTPNDTAFMLNIFFPVALGLFMAETKRFRKWILFFAMLIISSGMLLAMSRAGIGAFVVMALSVFFIFRRARRYFIALSLALLIGVMAIFYTESVTLQSIFFRGQMETRISAMLKNQSSDTVESSHFLKQRIQLWKRGVKMLKRSSFMGAGVGSYKFHALAPHGHSIYFSTVFDFGVAGLLVLIAAVFILARYFFIFFRLQSSYLQIMGVALFGGLIGIGIHGLVDFEYNNPLIWAYVGLTLSTINLIRWEASKNARAAVD